MTTLNVKYLECVDNIVKLIEKGHFIKNIKLDSPTLLEDIIDEIYSFTSLCSNSDEAELSTKIESAALGIEEVIKFPNKLSKSMKNRLGAIKVSAERLLTEKLEQKKQEEAFDTLIHEANQVFEETLSF